MTDTRSIEKPPAKEIGPVKTVKVREDFTFFDKPVESASSQIMETADVELNGTLIGGLIGSATQPEGKEIIGNDLLRLTFRIVTKPETEGQRPYISNASTEGFPLQKPMMIARKYDGKTWASIGRASGENIRNITFNDWLPVQSENKTTITTQASKGFKEQPLNLRIHELVEAKFKII